MSNFRRRLIISLRKADKQYVFDYEDFYSNYSWYTDETGATSAYARQAIQLKPNTSYVVTTNQYYNAEGTLSNVCVYSGSDVNQPVTYIENGVLKGQTKIVTTDVNGYLVVGIRITGAQGVPKERFESGEAWIKFEEV